MGLRPDAVLVDVDVCATVVVGPVVAQNPPYELERASCAAGSSLCRHEAEHSGVVLTDHLCVGHIDPHANPKMFFQAWEALEMRGIHL